MATAPADPASLYRSRLGERKAEARALDAQADRLGMGRLVTFLSGLALGWVVAGPGWLAAWWMAVPTAVFVGLVVAHDRVLLARDRVRRAVAWYERGLARIDDSWPGQGPGGDRFADPDHLYAQDLDLFGDGSLFQLLCTAQTRGGEQMLADWLSDPAEVAEVRRRQEAAIELRPRIELREQLSTVGAEARTAIDPPALEAWAVASPVVSGVWPRLLAVTMSLLVVAAIFAWNEGASGWVPVVALLALGVFAKRWAETTTQVMTGASAPAAELTVLGEVSAVVRAERYDTGSLQALAQGLDTGDGDVREAAGRLRRLVELHDWQRNMLFAPLAGLLCWQLHLAFAVEAWRARHGAQVGGWLRRIGEMEALAALGTYAFEHPDDPFPEVVEVEGVPRYEATALAHPLLPVATAVANDVRLGVEPRVLIVSGSNMSGKTTFLRSIGVSVVMALMGAPVRARQLCLSPLAIGATLRIEDSLQAGRSRFYTEVLRLGQVVESARSRPTLFLFDELFHGTNSHDRTEGARGLLDSLLRLAAIGLVTTHDLALSEIGDQLAPAASNVHFDDLLVDREMRFDYRLKPGPVTHSNALAIMRAVGLDIPVAESPDPEA